MRQPAFAHITGRAMWRRCDHDATRIEGERGVVMLAPLPVPAAEATDLAPWEAVAGSAAVLPAAADACADAIVLLADPASGLKVLDAEGWLDVPLACPPAPAAPGEFTPETPAPPLAPPLGVAVDPSRRIWLLTADAVVVLGADGRPDARIALPPGAVPVRLACTSWGTVVSDTAARLHVRVYGGEWDTHDLPAPARALAGDSGFGIAAAIVDDRLAVVENSLGKGALFSLLPLPLAGEGWGEGIVALLVTGPDTVLAAVPTAAPGAPAETRFTVLRIADATVEAEGAFAVRSWDGRALWRLPDGRIFASTPTGARALYADDPPLFAEGRVETYALDSTLLGCVWHRVFLDACVPSGTALRVEARTAEDLPPPSLRRPARPPADLAGLAPEPAWPPLLSLVADDAEDWVALSQLDARDGQADIPFGALADGWATLEGLIPCPPGRYLVLRVYLRGTARRSPRLGALRATHPRPSLLDHLPAYWRDDTTASDPTERALALFEGWVTELDARITALPRLFDPRTVPEGAMDWLSGFVALALDPRVSVDVRRQLLTEVRPLYTARGTRPGLERLLSILAEAPVQIVEAFRTRRRTGAMAGGSSIGPGLQLGDAEMATDAPWAIALANADTALRLRRAAIREEGGPPCPATDPPDPLPDGAEQAFYRRFAHRFTVIVPRARCAPLDAVLADAIELHKPAHTIHDMCWLDAGFRLGSASMVGISRVGARASFAPGVLGTAALAGATIGRAIPTNGFALRRSAP